MKTHFDILNEQELLLINGGDKIDIGGGNFVTFNNFDKGQPFRALVIHEPGVGIVIFNRKHFAKEVGPGV